LEADKFARQKAEKDLDAAKKKLDVLQNYTRRKMEVQFQADIDTAKAKCDAAKATYNLDESRLKQISEQIQKCTIKAKQPGQVVYANITERFGQETIIEEGTIVRERQVIIRLPNPEKMQVKVKVNEAKVALVRPGMPARIRLDAYPDAELEGVVESVGEYPAPGMWWAANVKEYDTIVKILKSPVDLRPGYTADVTILIAQESDVLLLPVQAVLESGGENYCVVSSQSGFEARKVTVGPNNDEFVVVREGLDEGDAVVGSPALVKDKVELPQAPPETMARTMLAVAKTAAASQGAPFDKKGAKDSLAESQKAKKGGRPQGPAKGNPAEMADRLFKKLDADGDGKLKADDLPAESRGLFAKADVNHDDFIDRAEFTQLAAVIAQQPSGGPDNRSPKPPVRVSGGTPGGTSGGGP
jgi:RND family efflux transporter MFP subunit